ncbi:dienelactone hydrolase [Catenulispora acidiphila DSM 44928]|uniref:Dienelactone hydrolase n=1 Tax=Catenulispora acidiphila (strain DSM 44928 / JCM 14897 / NBRC 102108 / NRRL B-24433 / ID139908) TaxID=479433 RepID=C7QCT8_CATAD|nr:dienelactone hydrolase [Catenulispora acidiphila DSM 44928]
MCGMQIAMTNGIQAGTVHYPAADGAETEAYLAVPQDDAPRGGVVLIHHLPGYDEATREFARTFAVHGYNAVVPNLYSREGGPGISPEDAAAAVRADGGVPDERLLADLGTAAEYLRALETSNGRIGVIGHCSGGRQALLAACALDLQAAVDNYGAFVMSDSPASVGLRATSVEERLPELSCPLLGNFGADDSHPSPEETARLAAALDKLGKTYDFKTYEGAGHAFFNVNRVAYRADAAMDAWDRIFDFYGQHLS